MNRRVDGRLLSAEKLPKDTSHGEIPQTKSCTLPLAALKIVKFQTNDLCQLQLRHNISYTYSLFGGALELAICPPRTYHECERKMFNPERELAANDVLVVEPNVERGKWLLGRVLDIY